MPRTPTYTFEEFMEAVEMQPPADTFSPVRFKDIYTEERNNKGGFDLCIDRMTGEFVVRQARPSKGSW